MRHLSFACVLLSATALTANAAEPRAIVEKAIQALGGAEKLTKIKAQTWKVNGKLTAGGQEMKYTADYRFAGPDKLRFDAAIDAGGQKMEITAATDGKLAWEQHLTTIRDMAKEKQVEFHHTVYLMNVSQLTPLLDKAFTLTDLGESKLGEQTVIGIKAAHPGRRDVSLYFDKTTGLLAKTSSKIMDEFQMKEMTQDNIFGPYKDVDGGKVLTKMTIHRDGQPFIVEEFSAWKNLDAVDAKPFGKPGG